MPSLEGRVLQGRYRIDGLIGRGGMAEVYRAWDRRRQYHVAVKVMREDLSEDLEFVRRFQQEAQALSALAHANIVRFYAFEQEGPLAFIVMDLVEGTTLRRRILDAGGQPLPPAEVVPIVGQVCAALHYAHSEGMLHRDVKPGNIMIALDPAAPGSGRVLLADFGISKAADAATATTVMPGTPAYMSPEQCRSEALDARSDVYALGIVVFEMLAGRRPFVGDTDAATGSTREKLRWEQMHAAPPSLTGLNPAVSPEMEQAVLKALAKDRKERWPTAQAFWQAFAAAAGIAIAGAAAVTTTRREPVEAGPGAATTVAHAAAVPARDERKRGHAASAAGRGGRGWILALVTALAGCVAMLFLASWPDRAGPKAGILPVSTEIPPTPTVSPVPTAVPPTPIVSPMPTVLPTSTPGPTEPPSPAPPTETPIVPTASLTPRPTVTPEPSATPRPTVPPTPGPTVTKKPAPKPTRAATAAPALRPLADSLTDFSGGQGQNSWEFLFAARDSFNWKQMTFDGSCYRSSEPRTGICADQGTPGGMNDVGWLYKAETSGKLVFKVSAHKLNAQGDDIAVGVYRHTNRLDEWRLDEGDTTGFTEQFEVDVNGGEMFFFTMHIASTWRQFLYDPNALRVQVYLKQ